MTPAWSAARTIGAGGWVIHPFRVPLELPRVEVDLPKIPGRVPLRLVSKVPRPRLPALAACGYRPRPHAVSSELHHGDETVPAGPIHPLRSRIGPRPEGRERSPARRGERHRDAWRRVAEPLHDVPGEPLESVDLPPRRPPGAEIAR